MDTSSGSSLIQKVSITFNIVLLAAVIYLLATYNEKPVEPEPNLICKDYSQEPMEGISFGTARNMFDNYGHQYKAIDKLPNGEIDAQSVWFDLETLKKYFYKIEDTLVKQKVSVPDLKLGIRIYYAAYPKQADMAGDPELSGLPTNYEFHHTVFMVPTFTDATDKTIKHDFNPWYPNMNTTTNAPTSIPEILEKQKEGPALTSGFILSIGTSQYIHNHGQVGPPPQAAVPGASYFRTLP
jgi:hypothetical protein